MQSEELSQKLIGVAEAIDGFTDSAEDSLELLRSKLADVTSHIDKVEQITRQLETKVSGIETSISTATKTALDDSVTNASVILASGIASANTDATAAAKSLKTVVETSKVKIEALTKSLFWKLLLASVLGGFCGSALMFFIYLHWPR